MSGDISAKRIERRIKVLLFWFSGIRNVWQEKLQWKGRDDFLPQLTMATNQPACWRLIIGRVHDWEQFALPTFSSTKFLSNWIYSKQKHVRKWVLVGEERGTRVRVFILFFLEKDRNCDKKKQEDAALRGSKHRGTGTSVFMCVCSVTPAGLSYRSGLGPSEH